MDKIIITEECGKECRFEYNKNEAKLTITFDGFLTTGDGSEEFMKHYFSICSQLNKEDTILILDSKELKLFEQEFLDDLVELYKDYSLFKKVYCVKSNSVLTNNQAQRLVRKIEMEDKFLFVDSISDIK